TDDFWSQPQGGRPMRAVVMSVLLTVVLALGVGSASAQPAITSCALTGVYVLAAALAFQSPAQLSGQFTFTTPGSCVAEAVGSVQVQLSVLFAGTPTPIPFAATLPYSVDATSRV